MSMLLEGLTREEELAWLMKLPWTFTSEPADDPGEYVVRVAEMRDAICVGTEREVSHEMFESLRASLEVRLEHGDPIPLPRRFLNEHAPLIVTPNKPNGAVSRSQDVTP